MNNIKVGYYYCINNNFNSIERLSKLNLIIGEKYLFKRYDDYAHYIDLFDSKNQYVGWFLITDINEHMKSNLSNYFIDVATLRDKQIDIIFEDE